jgi:hypothetical protein
MDDNILLFIFCILICLNAITAGIVLFLTENCKVFNETFKCFIHKLNTLLEDVKGVKKDPFVNNIEIGNFYVKFV